MRRAHKKQRYSGCLTGQGARLSVETGMDSQGICSVKVVIFLSQAMGYRGE
jgi:hypothetical protein